MWSFFAQLDYVGTARFNHAQQAWIPVILVYEGDKRIREIAAPLAAARPGSFYDHAAQLMSREDAKACVERAIANYRARRRAEPVFNASVKRNGGMWFAKFGRICLTFCISRKHA